MGAKNKKSNEAEQKNENNNNKKKDNGGNDNITAVLKADLHCDGCASKLLKYIRSFDGVKSLTFDESQKITVNGEFDPAKLREKLEEKTHKKVELISPGQPKKNDNNKEKNEKNKEDGKEDKNTKNKSEDKKCKDKKPSVTTAVLKVYLHCEGCIQKIHRIVTKTKGYEDMKIDRQKDLVTVTGAMDMKALAETLKKHLKKEVEILPPKKEGGGDKGKGGGDKGKEGGGGDGDKGKGGGKGKDGGGEEGGGGENKMQVQIGNPYPYLYGPGQMGDQFQYHPHVYGPYHAPQIFSDENPNACSVM